MCLIISLLSAQNRALKHVILQDHWESGAKEKECMRKRVKDVLKIAAKHPPKKKTNDR
jgi:hypothetical protein